MDVEKAAKQLKALSSPTRLRACRMLVRAGEAGLSVAWLREQLGIAALPLSHDLYRLILAGLVTQERQAATLIYRANSHAIDTLVGYLIDECCADAAP
jgi:DNA-binding transcriptional ArsR family regulator